MTLLGYILLPVGLAGLFFSKKWLYRLFVFWTLFSATSVVNVGDPDSGSALQVWMFFGFLWILRLLMENAMTLSFSIDRRILPPCLWLLAFLFVALFSLFMPIYIDGTLAITSPFLGTDPDTPLYFTSHNATQFLYLVFGVAIAICVAHSNMRDEVRHETEKIILLSALFISVWGVLQFVCNLTGIPYPDFIFNNSGSSSGKGFLETLSGIGRLSSVTLEPSVFAQDLITLLPLTLPAWLKTGSVFSLSIDRYCAVLFVAMLILSTSSTAYVGLVILALVLWPLLVRTSSISVAKASKYAALAVVATVSVGTAAALSIPIVRNVVQMALLNKFTSGSGLDRIFSIRVAFGYFQQFPILGIGWGSATSHDLIVKLLSNVGIIGTFTFLGAMYCVMHANWRVLDSSAFPLNLSRSAWFLSLTVFVFTSIFSAFPLAFGNFWLVLGMAISTSWAEATAQAPLLTSRNG
jgi:hypothetical protein